VDAYSTHERVQSMFADLMPGICLDEGLERMATWVRRVGARTTRPFANIEVRKNLPPSWA
jgi:hypothetical protein